MTLDEIDSVILQTEDTVEDDDGSSIFATVASISSAGLSLIFDGESKASTKKYRGNPRIPYAVGDRVKITNDSGTVVVDYPVGVPLSAIAVSTTSNNQGYTDATADNYLHVLNNIVGILSKFGFIQT